MFQTEFEDISRTLYFDRDTITVTTKTPDGKLIEVFEIQEFRKVDEELIFFCLTRRNEIVTFVMPPQEKVEIIDLYRRSQNTGEKVQVRFHVD